MISYWVGYAPRVVAGIVGTSLVFLASLTYEDEEGRLQNKLEDWWIALDERRIASLSWVTSFVQAIARLTGRGLDRIFGKSLFSPRAVAVSTILSISSLFLTASISLEFLPHSAHIPGAKGTPTALGAFISFLRIGAFAMVPALSESPNWPWGAWFPNLLRICWWALIAWNVGQLMPFLLFLLAWSPKGAMTGTQLLSIVLFVFMISLVCDISYVAFVRWMLRRISSVGNVAGIILGLVLQAVPLGVLIVVPVYLGAKILPVLETFGLAMILSIALNTIDILTVVAVLIVAVLMLTHRLVWPIFQRPIYAIQRMTFVKSRRWLWSVGIALLTVAVTRLPEWLESLFARFAR